MKTHCDFQRRWVEGVAEGGEGGAGVGGEGGGGEEDGRGH